MDPELQAELAALYADVDAEVAAANPRCEMSGRCCDFPRSEHELWSTPLEVEYARIRAGSVPAAPSGLCPWHVDGLCRLRDGRPLGCRLYFCDPAWETAMPQLYERYHGRITALHAAHGRGYGYARFVDAVRDAPSETPSEDPCA